MSSVPDGDHGPLIFGTFMCVMSLVPLLNIRDFDGRLARGFFGRTPRYEIAVTLTMWFFRAIGLYGLYIGAHFAIYSTPPGWHP